MLIGYARVSTQDQTLSLQQEALTKAGCERIFTEHASGSKADRPGLEEALCYARTGDTLVVCRLDRLERSLKHLIGPFSFERALALVPLVSVVLIGCSATVPDRGSGTDCETRRRIASPA